MRRRSAIDPVVFAESFRRAATNTPLPCLQGVALPSIRILPATEFYDYEAKYFRDDTQYHCPSGLDARSRGVRIAGGGARRIQGHRLLGLGTGRLHARARQRASSFSSRSTPRPGMTDHSLVPMAARQAGIDFEELVWRVLETSFSRTRK